MSIKILLELPYHCPLIAHDKGNDRAMLARETKELERYRRALEEIIQNVQIPNPALDFSHPSI